MTESTPTPPPPESRRRGPSRGTIILIAVLAGAAGLGYGLGGLDPAPFTDPDLMWRRLVKPIFRVIAFVSVGLFLGQLLESLGLAARLGRLAWPLIRRAHLPPEAGLAFTAAFASGVTANTLLYTSWQEGRLTDGQLVAANLLNSSLPAFLLHLPTTFFIVYGLLGRVALYYFGLVLIAAILRSLAVVVVSRFVFADCRGKCAYRPPEGTDRRKLLASVWTKFIRRLRTLALIIVPVYLVVFALAEGGFFTWLTKALAGLAAGLLLPVQAMGVVVFSVMAEFTAGFSAAAALLESGGLTAKQVIIALILGNILATPIRVLRHQLPHYLAIYRPGLGAKLLAYGQSARVASVALVLVIYIWLG